jgi:hypothetical protein
VGLMPRKASYGVTLLLLVGTMLHRRTAACRASFHRDCLAWAAASRVLTRSLRVRFMRSAVPFCWGVAGAEVSISIPWARQNVLGYGHSASPGNPADRSFRMSSHSYSPYDCLLVKTCNCKTRLASENAHDLSKPVRYTMI